MKVIRPTVIVPEMLESSSVPEPDSAEAAWSSGTSYAEGALAIRASTHRVYERLIAGTSSTPPESDATNWLDVGPTNRWAMFDQQASTATTEVGPLEVVIAPGAINSVAALDVVGTDITVTVTDGAAGPVVYTQTISLDDAVITDWYQYVWERFAQRTLAIFNDIPNYADSRVTVTLTGSTARCGTLVVGVPFDLGFVEGTPKIGIIDYSRKETDEFGTTTFVQRAYKKTLECQMVMPRGQFAAAYKVVSGLRATPCVWVSSEHPDLSPLIVYGFYTDFSITVAYTAHVLCSLEIEGLI